MNRDKKTGQGYVGVIGILWLFAYKQEGNLCNFVAASPIVKVHLFVLAQSTTQKTEAGDTGMTTKITAGSAKNFKTETGRNQNCQ